MIRNTFLKIADILYVSPLNFRGDICFNLVQNILWSPIDLKSVHDALDSEEDTWSTLSNLASGMQCTEFSETSYQSYNLWSSKLFTRG